MRRTAGREFSKTFGAWPLAGDAVDRDRLAALGRERLESEWAAWSGPVAPELRRIWRRSSAARLGTKRAG